MTVEKKIQRYTHLNFGIFFKIHLFHYCIYRLENGVEKYEFYFHRFIAGGLSSQKPSQQVIKM